MDDDDNKSCAGCIVSLVLLVYWIAATVVAVHFIRKWW